MAARRRESSRPFAKRKKTRTASSAGKRFRRRGPGGSLDGPAVRYWSTGRKTACPRAGASFPRGRACGFLTTNGILKFDESAATVFTGSRPGATLSPMRRTAILTCRGPAGRCLGRRQDLWRSVAPAAGRNLSMGSGASAADAHQRDFMAPISMRTEWRGRERPRASCATIRSCPKTIR